MKYFLSLEKHQIDEAISIGAIYFEPLNRWYVDSPEKLLVVTDKGWNIFSVNLYAKKFYIAKTFHLCEHCDQPTIVYAIILNDRVQVDKDLNLTKQSGNMLVAFHEFINWDLYKNIIIKYTHEGYRSGVYQYADQNSQRIIMNHCIHCMKPLDEMKLMLERFGFLAMCSNTVEMLEINEDIFLFSAELVWSSHYNLKTLTTEQFLKDIVVDYYSIIQKQTITQESTPQNELKNVFSKIGLFLKNKIMKS
ncbi:MAG: hypothetical protein E6Q32_10875 [Neisseriales bacterium]|nr:MAG: hypothetical protein E6Q32_10875 [Neisseriales bacterium]